MRIQNASVSIRERKSNSNPNLMGNTNAVDARIINDGMPLSSFGSTSDENTNNELQPVNSQKLKSLCQVCGDRAPEHIHYGSVSCFSCRAFFRRSVPKSNMYICPGHKQCSIAKNTRKNCQYCRYTKCLKAGMRPTWVLTDKEKKTRMQNKSQSRELIKSPTEDSRNIAENIERNIKLFPRSSSQAAINLTGFSNEDNQYIEELISAQHETVYNKVLGKHVAHAVAKCIQTDVQKTETHPLPRWVTQEYFRLQYSRVASFAMFIRDFSVLTKKSQNILLHHNLETMAIVRTAIYFKPSTIYSNKGTIDLLSPEIMPFKSQLGEMGFKGKMVDEFGTFKNTPPPPITIEQIFTKEWDSDHFALYHNVMNKLNNLIGTDVKLALLFQIINLFNTCNASLDLEFTQRKNIEASQEKWTVLLKGYLEFKFGRFKAVMILPKLLYIINELRMLSDKKDESS